ncbi:MAG: TRZ/ATZ family hydrolase [Burkholderiales bacterium]|nr:TRZ/ATZ family hydrolase [Burkholderiales bacterium]
MSPAQPRFTVLLYPASETPRGSADELPGTNVESIDLLIDARWVIPVQPPGRVLEHHSVAVRDGRILAVLPAAEAHAAYLAAERVMLPGHVLIPGLVNLHTHASMTLMRGFADDMALTQWLQDRVWPAEARHLSPQFVYDGTLLACAEMLRGGATCFNEMYLFPAEAARAAVDMGMRAALGLVVIDAPTAYAADADDYVAKGLALRDELREQRLLSFCMAPHAPYSVSDKTFSRLITLAEELELPVHMHVHESQDEIRQSIAQYGVRPLERLHRLGMVGPGLIAVHAVHLTQDEIALLVQNGSSVAHCPSSNLKFANGFAQVARMLLEGVNVGLGTDGSASNNRLDMFQEMRQAALLAKAVSGDARALPAHQALTMATLAGARALRLDHAIGSIEPGKFADLTAVDFNAPEMSPCYDPISHLVYAAGRENVSHVWVAGRLLVENRQLDNRQKNRLENIGILWQNRLSMETTA